jgi:pimeloyl-ACP methyl ester carboxylesterase
MRHGNPVIGRVGRHRSFRIAFAFAVVMVVASSGCAGERFTSSAPPTATTSTPSGDGLDTQSTATSPEVTTVALTIQDPVLGALTFDALAAGDPDLARRGRLVIMLHGFPETDESYRELLPPVAAAGYYAVALSQRGYSPGARPTDIAAYSIVNLVGDVARVADSLGATTFHVVGHDWGGAVAWVLAVLDPARVSSLTALSTPHPDALSAGIANPADPQHQASAYMQTFRASDSQDRMLANGVDGFDALFGPAGGGLPAEKVAQYAQVLATPVALNAALNWYRANPLPLAAPLGPVTVPTLYLWGSNDTAFTRTSTEATAKYVTGPYEFRELPGRSHWLPETASADIVAALLPHLEATTPG